MRQISAVLTQKSGDLARNIVSRDVPLRFFDIGLARSTQIIAKGWRRRRDSNPRYRIYQYDGLANRWFQPLTHVSSALGIGGL
jgi:hypothetical protein